MDMTAGAPAPRATRREWLGLAVLALPTMLTMLDISVLFLALPDLTADLGASASEQLWITDIYGFLIAGFLVTMGTLGDRVGRRKLMLIGAAVFGIISILAAWATSPELLIAYRALLGVAGATIMPATLALIMGMFRDPRDLGVAISVWASSLTAGVALGPIVGGVLLQWFWWGSAFLIGVPVMLMLLIAGPKLLPEAKNPAAGKLDPISVALSLLTLLPFIYGMKEIAHAGVDVLPVVALVAAVVFGVVFVVRQRRLTSPLLDLRLFAIRTVSGALVLSLFVAAIQGGTGFFVAQYLQIVAGLSPLATGLWILLPTVALIMGIFVSQGLAAKVRPAHIIAVSTLIAAVGMVVMSQVGPTGGILVLLIGFTIVYVGVSPVGPLVGRLVVPAAPPEKAGSAAGLQSTSGELGVALGIAVLGSVGVAGYRGTVEIPAELAGTEAGAIAGETAAGALDVARTLPPETAVPLVDAAKQAFTSGLTTAATISAVAFVALAGLALATLRQVPPMTPPQGPPPEGADAPADAQQPAAAAP